MTNDPPYRAEPGLDGHVIMQGEHVILYFGREDAQAIADLLNRRRSEPARRRRQARRMEVAKAKRGAA